MPGEAMVKLYCPKCQDVYVPKSSRHHHTDGAYFGTGFPHMLFMVHPEYRPKRPGNQFVPRLVLVVHILHNSLSVKESRIFLKDFSRLWHSNAFIIVFAIRLKSRLKASGPKTQS